ncbi:MAG: lycopene cyclase domain-containing protein [Patescibacteria group bacterium]
MPNYFIGLLIIFLVSIFIQYKSGIRLYRSTKDRLQVTLFFFVFGLLLDYFGLYYNYWAYPGGGLIGIRILGLPIEEFLFFLIAPYFALVFYKFYDRKNKQ